MNQWYIPEQSIAHLHTITIDRFGCFWPRWQDGPRNCSPGAQAMKCFTVNIPAVRVKGNGGNRIPPWPMNRCDE